MTEELFGLKDPVVGRLQQAFSQEEPATELAGIIQRAARYQAGEALDASDQPAPHRGLAEADLAAARQREPAAVSRVYSAYAPALFRFFMAEVGNRQEAQDLTGNVFLSAIQALPGFRGPVEALGGWLFRIARNDLYDYRRKQARSPGLAPLDDHLDEATATAGATEQPGQQSGTRTRSTDAPLNRLSPQEREVLALLANGWSNRRIAKECFLSLNTVRTHVQNVLVKLGVHSKLEAVAFAMQHGWPADAKNPQELALEPLDESRVMAALQYLPPDQREVLLLRMAAGMTIPEVAAALGKTTDAVKSLQHRARASLARALDLRSPHDPPDPRIHRPTQST